MRAQPAPIFSPSVNERAVPQKRRQVDDVTSLPLTRRQRYIYFLVDGRRSISALSRTTGQSVQEVELILRELQEQGLITV
jgi:predicted Rossmann fold nucleotide-binding protein DprA/Smf involved in DNA uptake